MLELDGPNLARPPEAFAFPEPSVADELQPSSEEPRRMADASLVRVLLVEDDASYARYIAATLQGVGSVRFVPDHAGSLNNAKRRLAQGPYDIVLLDLGLPDAQELDALTALVEVVPDLPIIILSTAENEVLALEAANAGAQDYLIKGQATIDLLARAIRYAIERKQSELCIKDLAYRDSLTHLPNRRLLLEHRRPTRVAA
jgi:PleD family two-component response regulator